MNFAGFVGASALASYAWSSFFLSNPIIEAAEKNNAIEKAREGGHH